MAKKPRPDLVDNCPNCGAYFQSPDRKVKENGKWVRYNNSPALFFEEGWTCMICGIHEGREIVQEGYQENGFFNRTYHPPVYGSRSWVFRRTAKTSNSIDGGENG